MGEDGRRLSMGHQQGSVNHQGQLNQWNTNVVHELTITRELKSEESRRIERGVLALSQ